MADPLTPSALAAEDPSREIVDALRDTKLRTHSYDEVEAMVSLVLRMERARVVALAPESVDDALGAYLTEVERELRGESSDTLRERFIALESAIAAHAVQAERARLLGMTPEAVVEAATDAAREMDTHDLMSLFDLVNEAVALGGSMALWQAGNPESGDSWDTLSAKYLKVRAAIERRFGQARIAAVEQERDDAKWGRGYAEAERDALRALVREKDEKLTDLKRTVRSFVADLCALFRPYLTTDLQAKLDEVAALAREGL